MTSPDLTFSDYIDTPILLADALQVLPVKRTGQRFASVQGTTVTFFSTRQSYPLKVMNSMPCVVVDINPNARIRYKYDGTEATRGIPLVVGIFTPSLHLLPDVTEATRDALELQADQDIRRMLGDMEQLLNSQEVRRRVAKHVEIATGSIAPDDIPLVEGSHVRARIAELWLYAWQPIDNH